VGVEVRDERILGEIRKEKFVRALRGRTFTGTHRHGKHFFADAGGETWLHLHFGMTGDLAYYRDRSEEPRFAKVVFAFEGGSFLAFEDMRLFGLVDLVSSPEEIVRRLGPDPLDPSLTFSRFAAILEKRKGAIKSLLLSQDIIAGIGNLYADETLFETGIHPRRPVNRLSDAEEREVFKAIRRILRETIRRLEKGADWPARYLTRHREEGERCPRCGGTIRRTVVFGRTTYFCSRHQK
jgi:formamidopyrimidine-DNA glycosylase